MFLVKRSDSSFSFYFGMQPNSEIVISGIASVNYYFYEYIIINIPKIHSGNLVMFIVYTMRESLLTC